MAFAIFSKTDTIIPDVPIDVRTGEYHGLSASAPSRAVQSGVYRSDHLIIDLDTLSISFEMGNIDEIGSGGQRATTFFQDIRAAAKSQQTFKVLTKHHLYPSMVITAVDVENSGTFNGRLIGTVSFQEYIETELAETRLSQKKIKKTANKTDKTAPDQVDKGVVQPKQSILAQLAGLF